MKIHTSLSKIKKIIHYVSESTLNEIAMGCGFVKRKKMLSPLTFLKAFSFGVADLKEISIEKIIDFCNSIDPRFNMSKQALYNRLEKGGAFLKNTLQYLLGKYLKMNRYDIKILKDFDDIKIFDSTIIELSDALASEWKGYSGDGSKSGIKITGMYSLYTKSFSDISVFNEADNDTNFDPIAVNNIKHNEIAIFDLGFFDRTMFKDIIKNGSYFISKVKKNAAFYIEDPNKKNKIKKIDILDLLKKSNGFLDTYLYLGFKKDNRIRCRVVAKRLPDEIINQKLRKANKNALKKGKTVTARSKEMCKWIIMITNICPKRLSLEDILNVYRIRWQIELIFKCWKSYINLKDIKNVGKYYVQCILYGKLILILLLYEMYASLNYWYYCNNKKELSMIKFFKEVNEYYKELCINLLCKIFNLTSLMDILMRIVKFSIPEKRKRKTTAEMLREISPCPYVVFP